MPSRPALAPELLSIIPDNVLLTDRRGRVIAANQLASQTLGLPGDLSGLSATELFPFRSLDQLPIGIDPEDYPPFEDILRGVEGQELRVMVKVGSAGEDRTLWIISDLSSEQDDRQEMIDYMADLTTAQAKIRDYTRQIEVFRQVVDGMDQGVFLSNGKKQVTFANTFANKLFGFDLTGVSLGRVVPLFSHIGNLPLEDSGLEVVIPLRGEVLVLDEGRGRETRCFLNVAPLSREANGDLTLVWTLFELTEEIANTQAFIDFSAELADLNRDLRRKNDEILRLSRTDFLTQIPNRGYIFELLDRALEFGHDKNGPVTVLLIDVDNFKSFNDHLGHEVGDAILKAIAAETTAVLGSVGTIGRYGGEEFLVVLPGCDLAAGSILAEKIRSTIASRNAASSPQFDQVTISGGLAQHQPGESRDALLRRADGLLYQAKHAGKNRIAS